MTLRPPRWSDAGSVLGDGEDESFVAQYGDVLADGVAGHAALLYLVAAFVWNREIKVACGGQ
jgi:hypothetical protein